RGEIAGGKIDARLEGDTQLGARLIRSYAREWLDGAGRFAALLLPYLLEDSGQDVDRLLRGWLDTRGAGTCAGEPPAGLAEVEEDEALGALHPSLDPELSELDDEMEAPPQEAEENHPSPGQYREP